MWYAPQRAFLTLESTQVHNRSGLSVIILKRKDLLEGDVCISGVAKGGPSRARPDQSSVVPYQMVLNRLPLYTLNICIYR